MFNRLRSLIVKELIQFTQDRLLLIFTLVGPLAEIILIGSGVSGGTTGIPVAVLDRDRSDLSRQVIAAVDNTPEVAVSHFPATFDEAAALIDAGKAGAVIVIPEGFSADLRAESSTGVTPIQLILDGSNVVVAGDAQSAAQGAIESLGWEVALASASGSLLQSGIDLRHEALYNQALEDRPYELTALLALIVFQIGALVGVMAIVREREIGTLEQVAVTPIRQVELILGKAISPIIVGFANFVILLMVVLIFYNLPLRGSPLLLALMTLLYLISEVSFALMLSALARTQQQAITFVFIYIMLALTMSGYMVPITRLPLVLRAASTILPVRHYMEIVRGVMLKGAGVAVLWPNIVALLVLDVAVLAVTVFVLRRLGR